MKNGPGARGLIAGTSVLLAALACAPISVQQEVALGDQYARQINSELPLVDDLLVNLYMNHLGSQIARQADPRNLSYHFYVVDSDVVNAFAVPGGHIYINRGLIERAESLAEVAGVTGHEIGHVVARHGAEQMARMQNTSLGLNLAYILLGRAPTGLERAAVNLGGAAIFAKYSRDQEREADSLAVHFLIATGIDPAGMPAMFAKLLEERDRSPSALDQFFATHPLTEDRIEETRTLLDAIPGASQESFLDNTAQFQEMRERLLSLPPAPDKDRES